MKLGGRNNGGRGMAICDATGFLVPAQSRVRDVRQGVVDTRFADQGVRGPGSAHPLEVFDPGPLNDPSPITEARSGDLDAKIAQEPDDLDPGFAPQQLDGFEG